MTQEQLRALNGDKAWLAPNFVDVVVFPPNGKPLSFVFRDEETADRVAKAMMEAVEQCGGRATVVRTVPESNTERGRGRAH